MTLERISRIPEFRGRILVVDDERDLREAIAEQLRLDGYQVDEAANGAVALERAMSGRPDVVVFDYAMPVTDGPAFVEQLRTYVRPVPELIGISAAAHSRAWGDDNGVPIFIMKPFEHSTLRRAVEAAAEQAAENRRPQAKRGSGVIPIVRPACVIAVGSSDREDHLRDELPEAMRHARVVVCESATDAARVLDLVVPDLLVVDDIAEHDELRSRATLHSIPLLVRAQSAANSAASVRRLSCAANDVRTDRNSTG